MLPPTGLAAYEKHQESSAAIDVRQYAYLVKRIAHHLIARLPASVQLDDLIQAGTIGLLEAAQKYDGDKGASFETYAGIRIRGAMVDEMRRGDWVPRSVHRNARRIHQAMQAVEARTGRDASDSEIAAELDVELGEYHAMASDAVAGRLFSYEDLCDEEEGPAQAPIDPNGPNPLDSVQKTALQSALAAAIDELPEREKLVLSLYYNEEMNLKEIGLVLNVSESRVCQIHSQAALRLKKKLSGWLP